jgi:hypothetical protein
VRHAFDRWVRVAGVEPQVEARLGRHLRSQPCKSPQPAVIFRRTAHDALFRWTVSFKDFGTQAIASKQGKGNRKARKKRKWRAGTARARLEAVSPGPAFAFFACFAVPLPVA